ncbi:uncharacterized protein LOC122855181 isoform X1 [Aphidius gifuensis]|uniref:uncharacterized protein LOC122855181 isoform X1 n=1 Tax=Aphidius gifuensis TaxID=684658 RepID=UPI001CDB6081|nr:uncharacterized protein LOC122855181 isoform X1 [Aphidius gifuensis]
MVDEYFFKVMSMHYQLVAEITEFNLIVKESRASLDYTTSKIAEAMKEIEGDIDNELGITYDLTKLNSIMLELKSRFIQLEERIIEFVRMDENMENVQLETPDDINYVVKKFITKSKKKPLDSLAMACDFETTITG